MIINCERKNMQKIDMIHGVFMTGKKEADKCEES